jgi:hypothetical protein
MKTLIGIPTLSRADLLLRNKDFLESVSTPDGVLIIDNGNQNIRIAVPIYRPGINLGVPKSWNYFLRTAFVDAPYDALVILQDDIIWSLEKLALAKDLLVKHPDVDLLLSPHLFSVQVHRKGNLSTIGPYDERFSPAWCEDDDYALTMTSKGRVYQRFVELDPLPGSIANGTLKPCSWGDQKKKLLEKWGSDFNVNSPSAPYYMTNRNLIGGEQ